MRLSVFISFVIYFLFATTGCDNSLGPQQDYDDTGHHQSYTSSEINDVGMQMRRSLRAMPEEDFLEGVRRSNNIVMVGFKEEDAKRGVSAKGKALVPNNFAQAKAETIISAHADSVVYEFQHIPSVLIALNEATEALPLRNNPFVDYVTPGSGRVTRDANPNDCEATSSPQTVPWNIKQVRADEAWAVSTGSNSRPIVIMDDGANEDNGWYGQQLHWDSYTNYAPPAYNDGFHGTPVLGAAIARDNNVGTVGVAPEGSSIIANIYGGGDNQWENNAAAAIDDKAHIAGVFSISFSTKQTSSAPSPEMVGLHSAIQNAYYQHNVVITASTGNQENSNYYAY